MEAPITVAKTDADPVLSDIDTTTTTNQAPAVSTDESGKKDTSSDFVPFDDEEEKEDGGSKQKKNSDNDNNGDDDVVVADEDQKIISKAVTHETAGIRSQMASVQAEMRASEFLMAEGNEAFKPYAEKIKEMAKHPKTQGLKIDAVVALALGPKLLQKLGADAYIKAQQASQSSQTGGGSRGDIPSSGLKPAGALSSDEWRKVTSKFNV